MDNSDVADYVQEHGQYATSILARHQERKSDPMAVNRKRMWMGLPIVLTATASCIPLGEDEQYCA